MWDDHTPFRRYGGEHCRTAKELQIALRRSGEVPLHISVSDLPEEMAQILVAERWRWEQFSFYKKRDPGPSAEGYKVIFRIPNEPLDLKKVKLSGVSDEAVANWVETIRPPCLILQSSNMVIFSSITWWSNLQVLNLGSSENFPLHGPSTHTVLAAVRLHLVELEIYTIDFEDSFVEPMEFPELLDLCLSSVSHWWMISTPKIVRLHLKPVDPAPSGTVFEYLQLKELVYHADKVPLLSGTFYSPQLVSLSMISPSSTKPGENLVWSTTEGQLSSMAAKEISIEGGSGAKDAHYKDFIESLRPHTGLEKLILKDFRFPILFYKSFLQLRSKKTSPLCPALRELEVDMSTIRNKIDMSQYDQVFKKITQERAQSASPLIRLYVTWPRWRFKPTNYTNGENPTEDSFWLPAYSDDEESLEVPLLSFGSPPTD
jgi:hypothetical protein